MSVFFRATLLVAFLLPSGKAAFAQSAAPHAAVYEFMTITTLESSSKSASKLFLTPAFQGKTEVQLDDFNAFASEKNKEKFQVNAQTVNQQLSELSVAGWELVQVYPLPTQGIFITRYLLRKAKN